MKRLLDLVLSGIALIVLSPLLLVLGAAVACSSPGGALYRQIRIGRSGTPFTLLKFRSMRVHTHGAAITLGESDPRITKIGGILRTYKLDELPQLWNVFAGDMSIVGPRPEVPKYVALYTDEMRKVLDVRPGLTDPASILGFDEGARLQEAADPEALYRNEILPEKVALQLDYLRTATLGSDIRVIARTLFRIFKR